MAPVLSTSMVMWHYQHCPVRIEYVHLHYTLLDQYWTLRGNLCAQSQIDINCAFVVDTSKLRDSGDTKCDDYGAWKQTKTATTDLRIRFHEDGSVASAMCCPKNRTKKHYTLVRRHYTCKSSPDLSRHISILSDPSGQVKPFQFIQN